MDAFFKRLVKSRMFWRYFLLLLLLTVIFDLVIAYTLAWKGITSGKWSIPLLVFAGITVLLRVIARLLPKPRNKRFVYWGRICFFISVMWAFYQQGFSQGMYFFALVFVVTKLLVFLLKRLRVQRFFN